MSESITLELPDDVVQRARTLAAATQRRLEDVAAECIARAVEDPPIELLSNADVLNWCEAMFDEGRQNELSTLLAANRSGSIADHQKARLEALLDEYRQAMIRKARAWKEAVARGLRAPLADHAA